MQTGLPPKVLKYRAVCPKSASAGCRAGVPLVSPHLRTGPAEPGLHLVGDVEAARRVHQVGDRGEEPGRVGQDAVGGEQRVGQERGQPHPVPAQVLDRSGDARGEIRAGNGRGHRPDVRAERDVGAEAGGELGYGGRHPVVGVLGHDHPGAAGGGPGDPQREVVRLASRAGEHRVRGADGVGREQPLGVVDDAVGQVPGVRVERGQLP